MRVYYLRLNISGGQNFRMDLTGLKSRCGGGSAVFLVEARGESLCSCLFQLLEAAHPHWLVAPASIIKPPITS